MKCEICGEEYDRSYGNIIEDMVNSHSLNTIKKMQQMSLTIVKKAIYFVCFTCEEIIEEEYKQYVQEGGMNLKYRPSVLKETIIGDDLPLHQLALSKYCRVCKSMRLDHIKNPQSYSKNSELILEVCKLMSMKSFENEDDNIYPPYLCHKCHLLFSRNYSIFNANTPQPPIDIICSTFAPHDSTNCNICCTLNEKDLITFETIPYEGKSVQWTHYENLKKLCRLCGKKSGKRHISKSSDLLKSSIQSVYYCNFENEDPNIYPYTVCNICSNKLNTFCYKLDNNIHIKVPPLHQFTGHSDKCSVCHPSKMADSVNTALTDSKCSSQSSVILYFHRQKLLRFCRICGLPNVNFHGKNVGILKETINDKLKFVFGLDVENENEHVYPPLTCYACHKRLNINYNLNIKAKNNCISFIKSTKSFKAHENNCSICLTSAYDDICESKVTDGEGCLNFSSYSTSSKPEEILLNTKFVKKQTDAIIDYGLPYSQLLCESDKENLTCVGCGVISFTPLLTKCNHIICGHCIIAVFELTHVCPLESCDTSLNPDNIWLYRSKELDEYFDSELFNCQNFFVCQFVGTMRKVITHQLFCEVKDCNDTKIKNHFLEVFEKKQGGKIQDKVANKMNREVKNEMIGLAKSKDLKHFHDLIKNYCQTYNENEMDVVNDILEHYNVRNDENCVSSENDHNSILPQEETNDDCEDIELIMHHDSDGTIQLYVNSEKDKCEMPEHISNVVEDDENSMIISEVSSLEINDLALKDEFKEETKQITDLKSDLDRKHNSKDGQNVKDDLSNHSLDQQLIISKSDDNMAESEDNSDCIPCDDLLSESSYEDSLSDVEENHLSDGLNPYNNMDE